MNRRQAGGGRNGSVEARLSVRCGRQAGCRDRVIQGFEDLNGFGVVPQCSHVIPGVAKLETDRRKVPS